MKNYIKVYFSIPSCLSARKLESANGLPSYRIGCFLKAALKITPETHEGGNSYQLSLAYLAGFNFILSRTIKRSHLLVRGDILKIIHESHVCIPGRE